MIDLNKCENIFIDFDGVIVDSNKFKEIAIEESICKLFGNTKESLIAIDYFNINAGISRKEKLSLFFKDYEVQKIMKIYSRKCNDFFKKTFPAEGLRLFLSEIKKKKNNINFFVLSGGEEQEIIYFLQKHFLINFFEEILASNRNKIDHLTRKQTSVNDIFIGDSKNDLKASLKCGIRFILFEEYKSLKSFPSEELIKNHVSLRTNNFKTLMEKIKYE